MAAMKVLWKWCHWLRSYAASAEPAMKAFDSALAAYCRSQWHQWHWPYLLSMQSFSVPA